MIMGKYKEIEMEWMEDPYYGVPDTPVGMTSFSNKLILNYFKKNGCKGICEYTGNEDTIIPLKELVMEISKIIDKHYEETDDAGLGWDPDLEDDGKVPGFHTEQNGYVVPDDRRSYDDMAEFLYENGFECNNDDILEAIANALPYESLIEKDPYGMTESEERIIDWKEIVRKSPEWLKNPQSITDADKVRYYELVDAMQYLSDIVFTTAKLKIYRTVRYSEELQEPVPFGNLTSPPKEYTSNLRMSRQGESMFYGASCSKLTLEECVGRDKPYAYTGKFEFLHSMLLLDLREINRRVTIFDIEPSKYHIIKFLQYFTREISKPVEPGHEDDYIPTQFVTSLFRKSLKKYHEDGTRQPIEGIIYTSSKNRCEWDVILFYDNANSAGHLHLIDYEKNKL